MIENARTRNAIIARPPPSEVRRRRHRDRACIAPFSSSLSAFNDYRPFPSKAKMNNIPAISSRVHGTSTEPAHLPPREPRLLKTPGASERGTGKTARWTLRDSASAFFPSHVVRSNGNPGTVQLVAAKPWQSNAISGEIECFVRGYSAVSADAVSCSTGGGCRYRVDRFGRESAPGNQARDRLAQGIDSAPDPISCRLNILGKASNIGGAQRIGVPGNPLAAPILSSATWQQCDCGHP